MGVSNPWEELMWWIQEKTDPFLTFIFVQQIPTWKKKKFGYENKKRRWWWCRRSELITN
jgi:hypothetical protein